MEKMISRNQEAERNSPRQITLNERQFENFYLANFQPKLAVNFGKALSREKRNNASTPKEFPLKNELKNPTEIVNKTKYNETTFKCLFNYDRIKDKPHSKPK